MYLRYVGALHFISIHAPLTGSDHVLTVCRSAALHFNPRSPYGERPSTNVALNSANAFQSTLPLRGATCPGSWERRAAGYFNPRSPYGERRITDQTYDYVEQFQSTLPLRGATLQPPAADPQQQISIHAPLTGSDPSSASQRPPATYFNPRSPYGERPRSRASRASPTDFNPRSPYGERPGEHQLLGEQAVISIHAPLTGSDPASRCPSLGHRQFQSTLPLRGATIGAQVDPASLQISIHAPLTGSDGGLQPSPRLRTISIHAPLTGSDQGGTRCVCRPVYFNPRSPYGERPPRGR